MNTNRLLVPSLLIASSVCGSLNADEEETAAIHKAIDTYVEAFNRGDAGAVAALWSETGEWVRPSGERIRGREAIRAEMEAYFAEGSPAHIELIEPQVRFLAETVAVEEARARVTRHGQLPSESTYIAIHVKQGDGWKLDSVRETQIPSLPSNYVHLEELDWMVGTWIDQDEDATIKTNCQWTTNRNFLTRSFTVKIEGKIDLEGTQVIGYDAANGHIRSWVFDSDGGFGEGVWTRDGDRWIGKKAQTLQDGSRASSINIITYINDNTCTWESTGREVDGELLPSIQPVTVVRATTADLEGGHPSEPSTNEAPEATDGALSSAFNSSGSLE